MKGPSKLTDAIQLLTTAEEKEGESHRIWDDACSNLAYARVPKERRDDYVRRTYKATRLHREAMEALRAAVKLLQSYR